MLLEFGVVGTKTLWTRYCGTMVEKRRLQAVVAVRSVVLWRKSRADPLKWCTQNSVKSASCLAIVTSPCAEATGQTSRGNLKQIPDLPIQKFNFLFCTVLSFLFSLKLLMKYRTVHPPKEVIERGGSTVIYDTVCHNFQRNLTSFFLMATKPRSQE